MDGYVDRLVSEINTARDRHAGLAGNVDTVFFGGGTPSLLTVSQMQRIVAALRGTFDVVPNAEITVEAAPGQLADDLLEVMLRGGVNRISLGVQSFVDAESRAVGRLHTAAQCLGEIERLHGAGVQDVSLDLIAGLPLQTEESFAGSIRSALESGVNHVSVYMLEVDEDSRLGSEVLAQEKHSSQLAVLGQHARYHAAAVPLPDFTAALYDNACRRLNAAGLAQYEISNFGKPCSHNLKYWHRAPYLGLGLDAHSMLTNEQGTVRFANADSLDSYMLDSAPATMETVDEEAAFEEAVFLGLRLVKGISLTSLSERYGDVRTRGLLRRANDLADADVLAFERDRLRLTPRGRMVSSTVFGELLA